MRLAIVTQEDCFVIPRNIEKILQVPQIEVAFIATIDAKGALVNRKRWFLKGFGVVQGCRLGLRLLTAKVADCIDRLSARRLLPRRFSVRAVADRHGIRHYKITNPNAPEFISRLVEERVDLIVSFSAPCVFGPELLSIPSKGCVNLHCSLLPRYAGLLPSFWVLYHGEREAGATVHYMDTKIDNGAILGQVSVPVTGAMSMMDVIERTKLAGGDLMASVVERIRRGDATVSPNRPEEGSYFSWPSMEQMGDFRRRGGRLI
jgi:methionyl-tRNA formyltransferase